MINLYTCAHECYSYIVKYSIEESGINTEYIKKCPDITNRLGKQYTYVYINQNNIYIYIKEMKII